MNIEWEETFLFKKINIELVHDFNSVESLCSNTGKQVLYYRGRWESLMWSDFCLIF